MGLSPSSRGSIRGVVLPSVVRIRPGRILVPVTRLRIILIFRARIAQVLIFLPPPPPPPTTLPRPRPLGIRPCTVSGVGSRPFRSVLARCRRSGATQQFVERSIKLLVCRNLRTIGVCEARDESTRVIQIIRAGE